MDFSEEWKSIWPISSVFTPPLLISSKPSLGPLFFNPSPNTLTPLFSKPSFSFPPHLPRSSLLHDRLHLLRCPNAAVLALFPTGVNSDQIGFLLLSVKDSCLDVRADRNGDVFVSKKRLNHRIVQILATPIGYSFSGNPDSVGLVLACTMYSVHWFSVRNDNIDSEPGLIYLGGKVFKSCAVVSACWSPHLSEECLVLLESGELFLFDLDYCCSNSNFKGNRLKIMWHNADCSGDGKWLGCEFSWHPRILIVARSDAVFLVDLRFDECSVSCLAKIGMPSVGELVHKEPFISFSMAGSNGFHFTVASNSLLFLYDIRNPLIPVLQWSHGIDKPCYVRVFKLSELRSHSKDDKYKEASESAFCIIMGSFWKCECRMFCYGSSFQDPKGSTAYEISKLCKSYYAWELPSELSLLGNECFCGTCLSRKEFLKGTLPVWVNWQQKKDIVVGFGILDKDLSALLYEPDSFGGFTLIRLMSSGKLESQRYYASWDLACGFSRSSSVSDVFRDISIPTSIHEVTWRRLWSGLPVGLLQWAFSSYSEFLEVLVDKKQVSLEFLIVPDSPQLPPFFLRRPSCRSNKWSHKVQRDDALVGPVLPLPILSLLRDIHDTGCFDLEEADGFSFQEEVSLECNEVMKVTSEMAVSDSSSELHGDHAISLANDREETWIDTQNLKPFYLYDQQPFSAKCSRLDPRQDTSGYKDERFDTLIFKKPKELLVDGEVETRVGLELFDDLSSVELKFDAPAMNFEAKELQAYKALKRQFLKSRSFDLYQDFFNRYKVQDQHP
ncbi:hypothetical protein CK203_031609 [Vitis vinifera]|uniref:TAF1C beta-propeller domain-containing protein n=1 Tax=Vitis vinifera TaxID=29760 RepID=A0A438IG11_VITVI|nr:hypothetical protein CK203_031609 [Vitis vinifera]